MIDYARDGRHVSRALALIGPEVPVVAPYYPYLSLIA
jgi:hypothetical protein